MSSYFRAVGITGFTFQLLFKATGDSIIVGTVTGYVTKDGGTQTELFNSAGGTGINHEGNGQWSLDITKEEMDADSIGLLFVHDSGDGIPVNFNIPTQNRPSPLTQTSTTGDVTTLVGQVRILIDDNDGAIFTEDEILFFLGQNDNNIYYASADALIVMASSAAKKASLIKTGTKTKDFRKLGHELRDQAYELRDRAGGQGGEPCFDFIEQNVSLTSGYEISSNRLKREGQ